MIMRSTTVVVMRTAIAMVVVFVGMSNAIRMGDNLPVLKGVGHLGHRHQCQGGKPKYPEMTLKSHEKTNLGTAVPSSISFGVAPEKDSGLRPSPFDYFVRFCSFFFRSSLGTFYPSLLPGLVRPSQTRRSE